jgi:membrane protein YqaA with SNARE-associated domain
MPVFRLGIVSMIWSAILDWLKKLNDWALALTGAYGGLGLFLVAFLDSSVLSFPIANDLIVIQLSIQQPQRMPYYAFMATLGSLAGSVFLYFLAKKGGEAMFRKRAGARAERIRSWLERNAFLSVAIPSVLPPPMPFKAFVLAAGVFQIPMRTFVFALIVGRGFRYVAEGILAIRYGKDAITLLQQNKILFTAIILGLMTASFVVTRLAFRSKH